MWRARSWITAPPKRIVLVYVILFAVAILLIATLILRQGFRLFSAPAGPLPPPKPVVLDLHVVTGPPRLLPAGSAHCPFSVDATLGESALTGTLHLAPRIILIGAGVRIVKSGRIPANTFKACLQSLPNYEGNPLHGQVINLQASRLALFSDLQHGGFINLLIRPSANRLTSPLLYEWQICAFYYLPLGSGELPPGEACSQTFTTVLAPEVLRTSKRSAPPSRLTRPSPSAQVEPNQSTDVG
jgi:hypothetical protein